MDTKDLATIRRHIRDQGPESIRLYLSTRLTALLPHQSTYEGATANLRTAQEADRMAKVCARFISDMLAGLDEEGL